MSLVTRADYRHFAWIVLIASVVRVAVLFFTHESLSADPDAYRRIASCLANFGTFGLGFTDAETGLPTAVPTAFRPPLYPWLISWLTDQNGVVANRSIALLHWGLGVGTVVGTYFLSLRLLRTNKSLGEERIDVEPIHDAQRGRLVALVAGTFVAVDPLLLQSASLVMTETLATVLAVLVLWLWVCLVESISDKGGSVFRLFLWTLATGAACSASYLCRPTFILWPLILCGYLFCQAIFLRRLRPVVVGIGLFAMVCSVVGLWTMRNMTHFGKPIWATTHGGYTLLLGNNPPFFDFVESREGIGIAWDATFFIDRWDDRALADPRSESFWSSPGVDLATALAPVNKAAVANGEQDASGEIADDRLAYETAVAAIKRRPGAFVRACWWRIRRLHSPLPLRTEQRPSSVVIAVAIFYCLVWILVFTGIWRLGRDLLSARWAAAVCLWVVLASVHTIYWTDMRMRSPLIPVLSILAAVGSLSTPLRLPKKSPEGTSQNAVGGSTIRTSAS